MEKASKLFLLALGAGAAGYIIYRYIKKPDISKVDVAVVYERATDGNIINRDFDDLALILDETKADLIFRGFWMWGPCANTCSDLPPEVLEAYEQKGFDCEKQGYSYDYLIDTITKIKEKKPDILFCGAIPAQKINLIDINPITSKVYYESEVEAMALDPAKWDITEISKYQLQKYFRDNVIGTGGYFPDITNMTFQELLLSWAKKQIDCGADAIWIDMLFSQARTLEKITGDSNHPAVKESFEAASMIVNEIHKYGRTEYNKSIHVGTWWTVVDLPYPAPNLDFITASPSSQEILTNTIDDTKWTELKTKVKENLGNIPILSFIDWGGDEAPMAIFSQKLHKDVQSEFLVYADEFFQRKGIKFIYPVHGGFMGESADKLSFGEHKFYDSLAPEFQTYDTIVELANIGKR